jgi:hypothetical protein
MCNALDVTPHELAAELDVPWKEFKVLLGINGQPHEMGAFDLWWKLDEVLNERLANLLAVQQELNRSLQADRVRRVARIERVRNRPTL